MRVVRTLREDGASLLLRQNGEHLELVLGNVVLLSSAALETERTFGGLASGGRILVGGLGFGATLRGVLQACAADAEVVVVEKLSAVIDLAAREAKELVGDALGDPRVRLLHGDVADAIAEGDGWTSILLDVDNGPDWASFRTNARLYGAAALAATRERLAPGGELAVWSGYPADGFVRVLRQAGFVPRIVPLHERGVVRARAYIGTRPAGRA